MCYYGSGRSFKAEIWQALVDSGLFGGANNIHIEGERYDSLKIVIGGRSSDVMKEGFNRRTTFAYLVPNVDGTKNFVVKVPSEEVFRRYVELYEIEARCFYLLNELSNNIKRESKNHRSVVLLDLNYVREISLVPLQDLQELQKMHYLAGTGYVTIAEYCERRSLGDMEPKKAIEILKNPKVLYGLLNTLLVLEEHDLVLRNIKLDSLFVRDDGTVVVGNLGLISKRPSREEFIGTDFWSLTMAIVSLLSEISGNREFMGSLALLRNENNHAEFRNQIGEMLRNMPNIYSGNVVALGMLAILKNLIKGCCEPLVKGRMSLKEALKQVEILMSLEENVRELAHIVKGNGEFFKFADIVACDLRESRLILGDAMGNAVEIDLTSLVDERGMCKVYRFFGNTRMRNILLKVFKPGVEKECKDEFTYNNVHNFLSRKNLASFFPVLKIGADCSYVILEDITSLRKISDFDPRSMVYIVNNNFRNLVYLMSELNKDGYLMVQCLEADNIGVRNDGSLVFINGAIVDMKSSHDFNALEKLHTKLKTPHCAPEILNGEPINPAKVDTWSMGILIYELFRRVLIGERNIEDYRNLATEFSSGTESLISEVEGLDPIVVKIINRSSLVDPSYRADSAELLAIVRGEMVEEKIEKKKMEKEDESEMLSAVFGEIPGHNQQQGQNRNMAGPKW